MKTETHQTPTQKKSYVYAYYLADQIIYVGIGTHDPSDDHQSFSRSKQFALHPEIYEAYRTQLDSIDVRILSENLTRKTALAIEGLLIRTLKPLGYLLNIQAGTESRLLARALTKTGRVIRVDTAQPTRKRGGNALTEEGKKRQAAGRSKGGKIGGKKRRKYSAELSALLNKAKAGLRQAMNAKNPKQETVDKWRKEVKRLEGQAAKT